MSDRDYQGITSRGDRSRKVVLVGLSIAVMLFVAFKTFAPPIFEDRAECLIWQTECEKGATAYLHGRKHWCINEETHIAETGCSVTIEPGYTFSVQMERDEDAGLNPPTSVMITALMVEIDD